jgi:hypothetical protein
MITDHFHHGLIMTETGTRVKFAMYSDISPRIIGHVATIKEKMIIQVMRNRRIFTLEACVIHQTGGQGRKVPE